MIRFEIEYTLPTADLFRKTEFRSRRGKQMAHGQVTRHRMAIHALLLATGQLGHLSDLADQGKPLHLRVQYSRPLRGRAFDIDNLNYVVNKLIIDPLVKHGFLGGDDAKQLIPEQPVYLGTEKRPRLILEFAIKLLIYPKGEKRK